MSRLLLIAGLGICLLAGNTRAQDATATDRLLAHLNKISHMQGQFEQVQLDENDVVLTESRGTFKLLRPFFFSWEITSPDSQLIVANAEYLWHYDIDLQTATRRPVVGSVETSPLQILAGDESVLREKYRVSEDGDDSFTLTPVDSANSFRRLIVTFFAPGEATGIASMDIVDRLGQRVVVRFEQVDVESPLTSDDFEFTPPQEGVDLFYYDE